MQGLGGGVVVLVAGPQLLCDSSRLHQQSSEYPPRFLLRATQEMWIAILSLCKDSELGRGVRAQPCMHRALDSSQHQEKPEGGATLNRHLPASESWDGLFCKEESAGLNDS